MEGLLLHEALAPLRARIPVPCLPWRFPDDRTAVLPLAGEGALWLLSRPPHPLLAVRSDTPAAAAPRTPFQALIASRAVGALVGVRQQRLDRVVELAFGAAEGFVPRPPVTLVAELTGRNANLVLRDEAGTILGVERVILHDRNRYRELRPGAPYRPPPPYTKLDPFTASDEALRSALRGRPLRRAPRALDGIGPKLTAAWAAEAGVSPELPLEGDALEAALAALRVVRDAPSATLTRHGTGVDVAESRRAQRRERALRRLRAEGERRLALAEKRLRDADLAEAAEEDAADLRQEADLLMAYAHDVPDGASRARLTAFDGTEVTLSLDPARDARGNARARYQRARKREARADRARALRPELIAERDDAARELAALDALDDAALVERAAALERRRAERRAPRGPGLRLRDPHGFEVVIGRNARENDAVTFQVARSRDLWLHAQGYPGAHVVVLSEGREVPFDTVLFAARLAAGHSSARQSDNVPVDYTLRKHVWKVKGQPLGAVHMTQQKTVYVTPARDDVRAAAGDGG